jgi:hypothetical protein
LSRLRKPIMPSAAPVGLDELIEMARTIRMTPEQAERQRRSFAYGNVKIENDSITWEMIHRAAEELEER